MDFLKKLLAVFTKKVNDTSDTGKVNAVDFAKLVKNASLVGLAAALSEVLATVGPDAFGVYQPLVIMGITAALDFISKLAKNNKKS